MIAYGAVLHLRMLIHYSRVLYYTAFHIRAAVYLGIPIDTGTAVHFRVRINPTCPIMGKVVFVFHITAPFARLRNDNFPYRAVTGNVHQRADRVKRLPLVFYPFVP